MVKLAHFFSRPPENWRVLVCNFVGLFILLGLPGTLFGLLSSKNNEKQKVFKITKKNEEKNAPFLVLNPSKYFSLRSQIFCMVFNYKCVAPDQSSVINRCPGYRIT